MERVKQALERARRERGEQPPEYAGREGRQPRLNRDAQFDSKMSAVSLSPEILESNRVLIGDKADSSTGAYKLLRARLLQPMRANKWNTITVVSPGKSEGKSLTSINLGINFAKIPELNVLLVDLDLRLPSVYKYLGFKPEKDLGDYLGGERDST